MRRILALVLLVGAATPALALVAPDGARPDPRTIEPRGAGVSSRRVELGESSAAADLARAFLARYGGQWELSFDARTGRATLVQGSGIPLVPGRGNALGEGVLAGLPRPGGKVTLETLEPLSRAFIEANAALLVPSRGKLELDRQGSSIRERGRLASLYFVWSVDGVRVEGARVFVRLNSGNLTQFGAELVGEMLADTHPTLDAERAIDALMAYSGDGELARLLAPPELLLQSENAGTRLDHRLVWTIRYRVHGRTETWEGRVDARSGEVVGFRDVNAYLRVTGGVYPRTVYEQNEVTVPFPAVDLINAGVAATTDDAGAFVYNGGSASSALDGRWVDTDCILCSNPAQPQTGVELGAGILDFGTGGQDALGNGASTPADRNTFYHLNQVRRVALEWLPTLGWLAQPIASHVNIEDTCNAYYDGAVNFYRSGGGCNNSGEIADVITHEWGHGIDLNTLGGDGATGEGTADVVAMHLSHSPLIGPGFRTDGSAVRNLDPTGPRGLLTTGNIGSKCSTLGSLGPLGYEVHCEGEIYGQTAWDLAQSLVSDQGYNTGWHTSERIFFDSLPDAGGYLATSSAPIYDAYLNADDDDGNLANGTPNAAAIFAAFDRHGIAGTARPSSAACGRPSQPQLTVTPQCDAFELSWEPSPGAEHYELFRGELRLEQALFPVVELPANQTSYTDAEVAPGMDYSYVVMAVDATGCESQIERPVATRLSDQPVLSIDLVATDDTPRGNRSGFPDPDEEVDLLLSVRNFGDVPANGLSGTITTTAAGVDLLDASAAWPAIDPGASAVNLDTIRIRANSPQNLCGDAIPFHFVPDEASGCATADSWFSVELGQDGVCDPTPACFVEPGFDGLDSAAPGSSCAEIALGWQPATSHCANATITYNLYRDTDPAFVPSAASRIAEGLTSTSYVDTLLEPGQTYYYIARAFDSRSGEDSNLQVVAVAAPGLPDIRPPVFGGLAAAGSGNECGETELGWSPALETCSGPVSYEIYRSTEPDFLPGPATRIGSTFATSFVDAALRPGTEYTYVVRSRDAQGNEETNAVRATVASTLTDLVVASATFESSPDGWSVAAPNDALTGAWEWGDPMGDAFQAEDCAEGTRCWITGLAAELAPGQNNDVDDGTTTLLSAAYDLSGTLDPAIRYSRWFTNDQGANPGEDPLEVEVSTDDGVSWVGLESVGAGTPLAWVPVEIPFPSGLSRTATVRVRYRARDLGVGGSLVEAGVDDFSVVDLGRGCSVCAPTVEPVGTIRLTRAGDDVVLDWTDDPAPGVRFVVYRLTGTAFEQAIRIGTTETRSFVHAGAALTAEDFAYRVSAVNACGAESPLD